MTLAALIDLGVDVEAIRTGLDSLGLPITLRVDKIKKGGFAATQVTIEAPPETRHRYLSDIEEIIHRGQLTPGQVALATKIFHRLAQAEAQAHGMDIDRVHFHEVGAIDSIADIVGAAIGFDSLNLECVTSRSVPTGTGTVQCAHGIMPVPTPATAILLQGVPLANTPIRGELTTPTGAAILTSIVQSWSECPVMTVERIGCGAGTRELLDQPNLLRIFVGEKEAEPTAETDRVWMLETNLDDLPAEIIGYCFEQLLAAGALDVFTTPVQMKKNRPGIMLSVLADETHVSSLEEILFRETATFGIRRYPVLRHKLQRESIQVDTVWGAIAAKRGWRGQGPPLMTPEYEDCARIAREQRIPLREVYAAVGAILKNQKTHP